MNEGERVDPTLNDEVLRVGAEMDRLDFEFWKAGGHRPLLWRYPSPKPDDIEEIH